MVANRWILKEWEFGVDNIGIDLQNKLEVEEYIEDLRQKIESAERELLMYAMANPKEVITLEDSKEVVFQIKENIESLLEYLKELYIEYFKIQEINFIHQYGTDEDFVKDKNGKRKIKNLEQILD